MTSKPVRFLGPAFFILFPQQLPRALPAYAAGLLAQGAVPLLRPADGPPPLGSEKLLSRCRRLNG